MVYSHIVGKDVLSTTSIKDWEIRINKDKVPEGWSEHAEFRNRREER